MSTKNQGGPITGLDLSTCSIANRLPLWLTMLVTILAGSGSTTAVAQQTKPPGKQVAESATAAQKFSIVIVEGNGAVNNIKQRMARQVMVQVEDENRKPVAGVALTFALPRMGASGAFVNGDKFITVVTDANGQARAAFQANKVSGKFNVHVSGSYQGVSVSATVAQANVAIGAISTGLLATIVAVAASGAVAGVVVATKGNGGGTPRSPTGTISPGSGPVFGPPR